MKAEGIHAVNEDHRRQGLAGVGVAIGDTKGVQIGCLNGAAGISLHSYDPVSRQVKRIKEWSRQTVCLSVSFTNTHTVSSRQMNQKSIRRSSKDGDVDCQIQIFNHRKFMQFSSTFLSTTTEQQHVKRNRRQRQTNKSDAKSTTLERFRNWSLDSR
jgi:hypothetical protein